MISLVIDKTVISVALNDSILNDSTNVVPSIFSDNLLRPTTGLELAYNTSHYLIWPTIILFIAFVLMVAIKVSDVKKISNVLSAVFSLTIAKQLYREEYGLSKRSAIFFSLNYILLIPLLIFEFNRFFNFGLFQTNSEFLQYLFLLIITLTVYSVKHLFINFLSVILKAQNLAKEYWFTVLVFSHAFIILLFPIVLVLLFSSVQTGYLIYVALSLFIGLIGFFFISKEEGARERLKNLSNYNFSLPKGQYASNYRNISADQIRNGIFLCSYYTIKQAPLLGYGIGDADDKLQECYDKNFTDTDTYKVIHYNSHNEYIFVILISGLIGFFVFSFSFFKQIMIALRSRNLIYLSFLCYILMNFCFENILSRHDGVLFFSFFNSILFFQKNTKS
jgi:hypothetical protein